MAEAIFAQQVRGAGLQDEIEIDSAGTGDWHIGQPAHAGTLDILGRNNVPYEGRARQVLRRDLDDFDYIIIMDERNRRDLEFSHGQGRAKIAPLLDYAPHLGLREVADPYFSGDFAGVYDLVREGVAGLLATIRQEHGL